MIFLDYHGVIDKSPGRKSIQGQAIPEACSQLIRDIAAQPGVLVFVLSYLTAHSTLTALLDSLRQSDIEDSVEGVLVTPARVGVQGKSQTISQFGQLVGLDRCLLVDDSAEIALDCDDRGVPVLHVCLPGRPWARDSVRWARSFEDAREDVLSFIRA